MKKKMYIVTILLLLIGSGVYMLLSLSESDLKIYETIESALKEENNIEISGKIEFTAAYSPTKRCVSYSIKNLTDEVISLGNDSSVYIKNNSNWIEIDMTGGYKLILNTVAPFEKREGETFFSEDLFEQGEYLIIKPITVEGESRYITAEFIVD